MPSATMTDMQTVEYFVYNGEIHNFYFAYYSLSGRLHKAGREVQDMWHA